MSTEQSQLQLIPREVLFGNPDRNNAQLSPCGRYLTYIAPWEGVLNIWLRTVGQVDDHPLTQDRGRGIRLYHWAHNGEQLVYVQDNEGDENHRLYVIDLKSGATRCLTPPNDSVAHKVKATIIAAFPEFPDVLIIGLNDRDITCHDLYRLNLRSGEMEFLQQAWPTVMEWYFDHTMALRGYTEATADGGKVEWFRDGAEGEYHELLRWSQEDVFTSGVYGFGPDNRTLYLLESTGRDINALQSFDPVTGERKMLASDEHNDISFVELHPRKHTVDAVAVFSDYLRWQAIDPAVGDDFAYLSQARRGNLAVDSRTDDDAHWLVHYVRDDGPVEFYIYHRESRTLEFMFYHRNNLTGLPLVEMQPVKFSARDGLELHGYLSLPKDWRGPGPLVLNVHGGPWGRDVWVFDSEAQWFANRGYACLQINFRGSTGYGKAFINAGDREWGGKMQDDLTDAVRWAVGQGIADAARVVIYGGSYGGYATLAGVTFTPDLYAAGVSIVGPSNMETFLNTIPPYWESFRRQMDLRVGMIPRYADGDKAGQPKAEVDWTPADREEVMFLRSRSPLFHVGNVRVPMLIAQGANDPRVNQAESDQFAAAMRRKGLQVEYVVYENEGHGFARPENRLDFYRRAEQFLSGILGGRCEA